MAANMNQFSHDYYNNLWSQAQAEFRQILVDEKLIGENGKDIPTLLKHRQEFLEWLTELYFQYLNVYKKFDEIYDQMVHPQKRPIVRQLLDLTLARLLEYQETMISTELSDYIYYEDIVNIYKYFPEETELPVPKYYYYERSPEVELRKKLLNQVLEERELELQAQVEATENEKLERLNQKLKHWLDESIDVEPKELIITIQTIERQRQAMLKYVMKQYRIDEEEKELARQKRVEELENVDKDSAAVIIQKIVRGFIARKQVSKRREKELIFLGFQDGPFSSNDDRTLSRLKTTEAIRFIEKEKSSRRQQQKINQINYEKAESRLESKIRLLEAPEMIERMKCQMRNWLLEVRQVKGKLPELPKAGDFDVYGSGKMFFDSPSTDQQNNEGGFAGNGVQKEKKKKASKKSDKEKKQKEKDKKKKKKIKKLLITNKLPGLSSLDEMTACNLIYNRDWRLRNELNNVEQSHDESMIIEEKRGLIGKEVREQVDALMKAELQHLKQVLEMRKKKKKKTKKGKRGRKGRRRGKGRKKKKKKKSKDLTPDRTCESLFIELVEEGIIKKVPNVTFKDLVGSSSFVNQTIRKYYIDHPSYINNNNGGGDQNPNEAVNKQQGGGGGIETMNGTTNNNNNVDGGGDDDNKMPIGPNPPPTFGDIKRALKDLCVLPMGSDTVHKIAPYTKSIFLAGASGSGKKSLVYAICNELEATLFDLSPRNLVGKYEGKHGLIMLFHLLDKVGHWCEPMIIMIDNAEMAYMKRVPKTENSEPKRIKKQMSKFIKMLSSEDRMMIFGLSSEPWAGKFKPMKKDYQKFIYIPKPCHGDRLEMWSHELKDHLNEFNSKMNLNVLAKLTDGWTLGDIKSCIKNTLDKHYQILQEELELHQKPFTFDPEAYLEEGALHFKPVKVGRRLLDMNDFIEELIYIDPIFLEEEKAWNNWYSKTPLQKARLKAQLPPEDEITKKKKNKAKAKKKKGITRKKKAAG